MIRALWPLLEVTDVQRSLAFYSQGLGFSVVATDGGADQEVRWARVERDGASLMLQQSQPGGAAKHGRGVCFYFVCDDADAIYAELSARGLTLEKPEVAYYGMKQVELSDPDGYALCFESPLGSTAT